MGISAYTKTAWANGVAPAINATNLNKIEDRLYDLTEEIITPTMSSTTTVSTDLVTLPATTLKGRIDIDLIGNTQTPYDQYTKLLMHFEGLDASTTFKDQTGKTVVASGNAQIDTAQYRYGSASGLFDGTGDYLTVTDANNDLDIGTQDFTIEFWYRPAVLSTQCLIDFRQSTGTDVALNIYMFSDGRLFMQTAGVERINGTNYLSINKWYHIAVVRSGTSTKMFLNGGQEGNTYTDTNNYIAVSTVKIGAFYSNTSTLNGWIDELRISVGTSRYTSNFIPIQHGNLSTNKQLIKVVGKNLFNQFNVFDGKYLDTSGVEISNALFNISSYIMIQANTSYRISGTSTTNVLSNNNTISWYDSTRRLISTTSFAKAGETVTSPTNAKFARFSVFDADLPTAQLELGSTATTYEAYTETTALLPADLKKTSSTVFDIFQANEGILTKNISDFVNLTGSLSWQFHGDKVGHKRVYVGNSAFPNIKRNNFYYPLVYKFNEKVLVQNTGGNNADEAYVDFNAFHISISDTDSGWDEAWVSGTSFTGMTWSNLIKAYFNGWKLTTANTNVSSCVWTGIVSGTTQSGSGGYSYVIANIDTGYTPYKMIYQLAIPNITNYFANTLIAEPTGTIYSYSFVSDFDFYDVACGITDVNFPINFLEYVNVVNKTNGSLTPIDLGTCTVSSNGYSFTSTALTSDDLIDFGYVYKDLSNLPDIVHLYATDMKGTINGNTNDIKDLDKKVDQLNIVNTLTLKEIERDARILKIMGGI